MQIFQLQSTDILLNIQNKLVLYQYISLKNIRIFSSMKFNLNIIVILNIKV